MFSLQSSDIPWEAVKVARLMAGIRAVDGMGTLAVVGGWIFGVDGDAG